MQYATASERCFRARPFHVPAQSTNVRGNFWRVSGLRWQNPDAAKLKELSSVTRISARIQNPEQNLVFIRTRRQPAFSRASVVFTKMGKIAFAWVTCDRTVHRSLNRGLARRENPWIFPQRFSHARVHRWRQSEYAVIGLMRVRISVSFVTGNPPSRACSKTRSSFSPR